MSQSRVVSYLRRGWTERPDLIASLTIGVAGLVATGAFCLKWFREPNKHRVKMYRDNYTVIRSDEKSTDPVKQDLYN